MAQPRTLVVLPPDLVKEVDALVGSRKRSAFFAELARKELKRRRLLLLLGDWKLEWAARGVQLTLPGLLIAATAIKHGATLVTGNAKDFPQKGLKVLTPPG